VLFHKSVILVAIATFCTSAIQAQSEIASPDALIEQAPPPGPSSPAIDNRVFGVLPNYRTANLSDPYKPLTAKRKFYIGYKDSTDYPLYVVGAFLAGIGQATDQHPAFGQGMEGYAKRFGASSADLVIGNFMTESIMPALLRQDPRYFQRGEGSTTSRAFYAASRIFVARNDRGRWTFNSAEVLGNAVSVGISNAYYPGERRLSDNVQRLGTQLATDAFSQILKEFWPDIKRKIHRDR
jgi:hypothetical protein